MIIHKRQNKRLKRLKKYVLVLYVHCREDNKYYIQKGVAMRRVLRLTEIMCLMNNEQIAFGLK